MSQLTLPNHPICTVRFDFGRNYSTDGIKLNRLVSGEKGTTFSMFGGSEGTVKKPGLSGGKISAVEVVVYPTLIHTLKGLSALTMKTPGTLKGVKNKCQLMKMPEELLYGLRTEVRLFGYLNFVEALQERYFPMEDYPRELDWARISRRPF